ncbi:MAG TPA: RNA methyltransferase [Candidatus Limnocylindria bacterium]|nr:RNA methyltransferase [Candidatus Limnocylindria bacterium]
MAELYVALLHHPVFDKNGAIVTTAVTNLDVHDISRLGRTFGVRGFYVCTPVPTLRRLVARIMRHWETGPGSTYNTTRKDALSVVRLAADLDEAVADVERESGTLPRVVATSARPSPRPLPFAELRRQLDAPGAAVLLVLGTGWGLAPQVMERADAILEPIRGTGDYNHLSVRAAAAIMLDRLRGDR